MQEIHKILDDQPSYAREMVDNDIRNLQAHQELQAYNDHQIFLYRHPFTRTRQYYDQNLADLYQLKTTNPEAFLRQIANIRQNIRRIESAIRKKKYKSETELQSWQQNLANAETKNQILLEILAK
jgi:hypothetical protein